MKLAALTAVMLMASCPTTPDGKIDPYLTAHTIINQAQASLYLSDAIFNQWLSAQTDPVKMKKAQEQYNKIRTAVANGLVLAHDAVDIAKAAKEQPDVGKILASADVAWKDLLKLLNELLGTSTPTTQPIVAKTAKPDKVVESPLKNLPKSLIPSLK